MHHREKKQVLPEVPTDAISTCSPAYLGFFPKNPAPLTLLPHGGERGEEEEGEGRREGVHVSVCMLGILLTLHSGVTPLGAQMSKWRVKVLALHAAKTRFNPWHRRSGNRQRCCPQVLGFMHVADLG